jgi:glycosyltransferase 2 family protein
MKRWQFWIGLAISAFFLYYTLSNQPLADMWDAVIHAQFLWLIPGVAIYFIGVWARTWRWHYLLRPIKKIPLRTLFPVVCIGYMGNNIYPARAGEVLRAYVLKRREGVAISASIATIFIERIFDAVVMMLFVFVNLPELAGLKGESGFIGNIQELALIGTALFFGALLVFLLAAMFPAITARIVEWMILHLSPARFQPKLRGLAARFLEGIACLRSPRDALMVFLTSLVVWLLETGKYWFVMHGFPFTVSFFALMLMNGIVNIATILPAAPGYIGTFDAPGVAVLQAYGVGKAVATAYTFVLHAALWFPITILGAYFMLREGLSVKEAREEAKTE